MKHHLRLILFLLVAAASIAAASGPQRKAARAAFRPITIGQFQASVRRLLYDTLLRHASVGVSIVSVNGGRIMMEQNARQFFHPASTAKLFTTSAALAILGKDWQCATLLTTDGHVEGATLNGNLIIRGAGDPLFRVADMDSLATTLRRAGITRISGDLIANVSLFDSVEWGKGWMWDDEPDPDEAFLSPVMVERNAVHVTVSPADSAGKAPSVEVSPPSGELNVDNSAVTSRDPLIPELTVTREPGSSRILVRGGIHPGDAPVETELSVRNPTRHFLTLFSDHLRSNGIELSGAIRTDTNEGTRELARVSRRLDSIVTVVNKESYNLGAESLLKILAVKRDGPPGTASQGITVLREFFAGMGLDTTELLLVDGSGVSWYNLATPAFFTRLLRVLAVRQAGIFPAFLSSLPVAGVDGTLKDRLELVGGREPVRAKTGTLSGVSTLAGYAVTRNGVLCAFCIMCDHLPGEVHLLHNVQDDIVRLLARLDYRR